MLKGPITHSFHFIFCCAQTTGSSFNYNLQNVNIQKQFKTKKCYKVKRLTSASPKKEIGRTAKYHFLMCKPQCKILCFISTFLKKEWIVSIMKALWFSEKALHSTALSITWLSSHTKSPHTLFSPPISKASKYSTRPRRLDNQDSFGVSFGSNEEGTYRQFHQLWPHLKWRPAANELHAREVG